MPTAFITSSSERSQHNPFWHLRTDGVWQFAGPAEITSRPAGATPTITELRRGRVAGGFAEPVLLALARNPALAAEQCDHALLRVPLGLSDAG